MEAPFPSPVAFADLGDAEVAGVEAEFVRFDPCEFGGAAINRAVIDMVRAGRSIDGLTITERECEILLKGDIRASTVVAQAEGDTERLAERARMRLKSSIRKKLEEERKRSKERQRLERLRGTMESRFAGTPTDREIFDMLTTLLADAETPVDAVVSADDARAVLRVHPDADGAADALRRGDEEPDSDIARFMLVRCARGILAASVKKRLEEEEKRRIANDRREAEEARQRREASDQRAREHENRTEGFLMGIVFAVALFVVLAFASQCAG